MLGKILNLENHYMQEKSQVNHSTIVVTMLLVMEAQAFI